MIYALVIGGIVVYVIGSYALVAKFLSDNPGPGGLGWLAFPAAPLMIPLVGWQIFKGLMRRVFA